LGHDPDPREHRRHPSCVEEGRSEIDSRSRFTFTTENSIRNIKHQMTMAKSKSKKQSMRSEKPGAAASGEP
jgi:hypothetical protein